MRSEKAPNGNTRVFVSTDSKCDAQSQIKLVRAWAKANGLRSKLIEFYSIPSEWSNLVVYYRARILVEGVL